MYEIVVVEAAEVPVADSDGGSDPFLVISIGSKTHKTSVVKHSLNPVWNETKVIEIKDPMRDGVGFLLYDWDRFSVNDLIAYGFMSMIGIPPNGSPVDVWIPLYEKSKKAEKKEKKEVKEASRSTMAPKPPKAGGRLHLVIRALDDPKGGPATGSFAPTPLSELEVPPEAPPGAKVLSIQTPYRGAVPSGFQLKCGYLRPKKGLLEKK